MNAEERVEGKGKAQEGTKCEEKPNEREKEDAADESVFDVDPPHGGKRTSAIGSEDVVDPSALDLHFTLDSRSALDFHSHSTEHDLTALHAKLTIRRESLDQRELGLPTRQERIEGMDERARELEEETEKRSAQFGGLNASTSALGSNSWPITLLESVVFRVLGDKTSSLLFCSCTFLLL